LLDERRMFLAIVDHKQFLFGMRFTNMATDNVLQKGTSKFSI
jgi:hypothetical protein